MICVNSVVTLVVDAPVVIADCDFNLTASGASVPMDATCQATVSATLAAGADVTGVTFTSPTATPTVTGNTASLVVTEPGNYTITATGTCDGNTVTDSVTVAVSQGLCPLPECGFSLVADLATVDLDAACAGTASATVTAGANVTGIAFQSSAGVVTVVGNTGTVPVTAVGTLTITATGTCDGNALTDTVTIDVAQGLCPGPNEFVVGPLSLDLVNEETGQVTTAANNDGVVTVVTEVPYTEIGGVYTFGPTDAGGTAVFTATYPDGTTEVRTVTIGHTVVVPGTIESLKLTVFKRVC